MTLLEKTRKSVLRDRKAARAIKPKGLGKGLGVDIQHRDPPPRTAAGLLGLLEHFYVSLNRRNAPGHCFVAFPSREPVATSLENALTPDQRARLKTPFDGLETHVDQSLPKIKRDL